MAFLIKVNSPHSQLGVIVFNPISIKTHDLVVICGFCVRKKKDKKKKKKARANDFLLFFAFQIFFHFTTFDFTSLESPCQ